MIDFRTIELKDKSRYNAYLYQGTPRGCEFSFSNLFMWGLQGITELHNHMVLYSRYDRHCFYPFPIGARDKKAVLDAIFADAKERGICPCLTGLNEEAKSTLETLYPNQFYFHADRNNYDYVYDINDLADLKGRKLHRKRNHLKHFKKMHPDYVVTPITPENMDKVRAFVAEWYKLKLEDNPDGDYRHEQAAFEKVFTHYSDLEMDGLLLEEHGEVLGFTMASQMSPDTYDVHFEKARGNIDGAYTTINSEFANYIRNKHPHIKYLDREEDMGIPGLRKAKMSYFPHHLVKKYKAFPLRQTYTFASPDSERLPELRGLWQEAFGDSEQFLDHFYSTAFDTSRCRVATVDGKLAAVLYWFDCSVGEQHMAYIYAVATAKEFRGNGACHMLLADTHEHLKALGYAGTLLVPGNDALVHLYEGCEYETCTKRTKIECIAANMGIEIREILKEEYATLRRAYLPKDGVVQEGANLEFLETQAKFYIGRVSNSDDEAHEKHTFLLAAHIENDNLYGMELLGDTSLVPGILHALGCKDGTFFTPGKDEPFAMFHALIEDAVEPSYFGFAFD
ncbi:MAG: GNAT family N-acetyltransferase [Agathobacter sp.]|nr:GNAT family N-acetyltransferase [Agathobacter sp.]